MWDSFTPQILTVEGLCHFYSVIAYQPMVLTIAQYTRLSDRVDGAGEDTGTSTSITYTMYVYTNVTNSSVISHFPYHNKGYAGFSHK